MGNARRRHGLQACFRRTRAAALLPVLLLCAAAAGGHEQSPEAGGPERPVFREIWAYLLRGEEAELTASEPITDLCYFGLNLARNGRLAEMVARPRVVLQNGRRPAVHLVIAELTNQALMHFSLSPQYGVRPLLVEDIRRAAEGFDGVQIDFEAVSRDDADLFADFLKELRGSLPAGKRLSVAVPARTEPVAADAYDYARIGPLVDRLVIMAYDEHWSTSSPGPVASLPWCAKVVDHARRVLARDKIVMGLPLYGRAWPDKRLSRALRFRAVQDLVAEKQGSPGYAPELGAHFEYAENVLVKVFYDDERSLLDKLRLYRAREVDSVSFWRIGQGPPGLWGSIGSSGPGREPPAGGPAR